MDTSVDSEAQAKGVVAAVSDEHVEIEVPGTDYRLRFRTTSPIAASPGQRVSGTIHAEALRMHAARGGGRFIEPLQGEPRIVGGTIAAVDEANSRALLRAAVPIWVTWQAGQDTSILHVGQLVNCHVRSGSRFEC